MAVTDAVGPIYEFYLLGGGPAGGPLNLPSPEDLLKTIEGFSMRLLMLNDLDNMRDCINLSGKTAALAYQAYKAFAEGDDFRGSLLIAETIAQLYTDVDFCEASVSDKELHAFTQWLKNLASFEYLTQAATANMHLHYQEI